MGFRAALLLLFARAAEGRAAEAREREALKSVIDIDSELPGGCYKKAWAVVNATETAYPSYVSDF